MFVLGAAPNSQAEPQCSNASLRGAYGFHALALPTVPGGTPRTIIGVFNFDGRGNWTTSLTINNNGAVHQAVDSGSYAVNADCSGTLLPASGGSVAIVVVDDGKEFYQMRTDPASILMYSVTKRIFPGSSQ
jgi:hypothetical protein